MSSKEEEMFTKIVGSIIFLIITPVFVVYDVTATGYVMSKIWGWYLESVFDLKLSWLQCGMIFMLVSLLVRRVNSGTPKQLDEGFVNTPLGRITMYLVSPWVTLLFAWLFL